MGKNTHLYLPMQEVEINHFRDVKLYQLGSRFIIKNHRIFLIQGHEFPYIFNTKGGNLKKWIFKVSNLAFALCFH